MCDTCQGGGEIAPDAPCPDCDGTGICGCAACSDPSIIEAGDIPGMLSERTGIKRAYGILWTTWGDKDSTASVARRMLMDKLTYDERREGIEWAIRVLGR
jgi:hypothetical protein